MSDRTGHPDDSAAHTALADRFARLRAAEAATAPPIVSGAAADLARRAPARHRAATGTWPRAAAAVALAAFGALLLRDWPRDDAPTADPTAVYAAIMATQPLQTDALLEVSDEVLPGMTGIPDVYHLKLQPGGAENTN